MTGIITTREDLRDILREELPGAIERIQALPNPEKLFTRAQAARKLGKSPSTIQRMIYQGRIRPTSDQKYISQQAITNYLTGQQS